MSVSTALSGRLVRWLALTSILLALVACSQPTVTPTSSPAAAASGSASESPSISASASPSASATPDPASAQIELVGDETLTEIIEIDTVLCALPDLNGTTIALYNSDQSEIYISIALRPDLINVHMSIGPGQGQELQTREFTGSGISNFDPATGAQLDSALTEVPPGPTSPGPGTIGTLSSINGNVDCGNQTTGASTITLSGETPYGAYEGGLDPVHVFCTDTEAGQETAVYALSTIAGEAVYVIVRLHADDFTVLASPKDQSYLYYTSAAAGEVSITDAGGQVAGTALDERGGQPLSVRVEGEASCGS